MAEIDFHRFGNAFADGARERVEVMWLNPACCDALDARMGGQGTPLFQMLEAAE